MRERGFRPHRSRVHKCIPADVRRSFYWASSPNKKRHPKSVIRLYKKVIKWLESKLEKNHEH